MKLIFERSQEGVQNIFLPECDVPLAEVPEVFQRESQFHLPEVAQSELSRHYSALAKASFGVNAGFFPLGSCTMKYNPKINDEIANLAGFAGIHPLQPENTVQGSLAALHLAEKLLTEITGMDKMTFQPAAGAHGELTALFMIKAYHTANGETQRAKIIVPDSAHGTNPASVSMAGFTTVNIPSDENGCVDLVALKEACGEDTAGLMLTNPNTLGIFDPNIAEITEIVHDAGGLNYYDGANLNAIMGIVRPGDTGFDVIHLNLHKTFSTPHGGGGPGSGPVGCKAILTDFLPLEMPHKSGDQYTFSDALQSIGRVKAFYGHFGVVMRALTYILSLGKEGIPASAKVAVLNANYLRHHLGEFLETSGKAQHCMHEFVLSLERFKKDTGVTALDFAKGILDEHMYPPTMYFPLIVKEALMIEPTETETKETLDEVIAAYRRLYDEAYKSPEVFHEYPLKTDIRRVDEVKAARHPVVRYSFS